MSLLLTRLAPFAYIVSVTPSAYSGSATSSFTVNMPAVRPNGDLYIVLCAAQGVGADISPAAGWTEEGEIGSAHEDEWARRFGSSEPATYTWTSDTSSTNFSALTFRIANADTVTPIHQKGVSAQNDTTSDLPSLTTTLANCLLIGWTSAQGGPNIVSQPSGYTVHDTSTLPRLVWCGSKFVPNAGVYAGTVTWDAANFHGEFHLAVASVVAAAAGSDAVIAERVRRVVHLSYLVR